MSHKVLPFHERLETLVAERRLAQPPPSKWPQAVTLTLPSFGFPRFHMEWLVILLEESPTQV